MTAASKAYANPLLGPWIYKSQLASASPVQVYDIGLDEVTLSVLKKHGGFVRTVPTFWPHWRKHFTWKIWCWNDAPASKILWLDAGLVVLQPIDEVFDALEHLGYFFVPNYQLLDWEASDEACEGCGVPAEFRNGKPTLAGGLVGLAKWGRTLGVVKEALSVALTEKHIAATKASHRHDQAIMSLLMYKHFGQVVISDGVVYLGENSPNQVPGQKIWVHRRSMFARRPSFSNLSYLHTRTTLHTAEPI